MIARLVLHAIRDGQQLCRSSIVAAVIAAGVVGVREARAEDPCAADVKQLCGDIEVGGGRVRECLRQNETKLSAACKAKRAAADARFRSLVQEFATACRRDIVRLCHEVKPGDGRVVACLMRQQDDLTSSCRPEIERAQKAIETISAVRAACRADAKRLCAGVPVEATPLLECLQANRSSLSDTCRSLGPETALVPAELVDAVDSLETDERSQEARQILQVSSPSRSRGARSSFNSTASRGSAASRTPTGCSSTRRSSSGSGASSRSSSRSRSSPCTPTRRTVRCRPGWAA